jgi:hypothetical protein
MIEQVIEHLSGALSDRGVRGRQPAVLLGFRL